MSPFWLLKLLNIFSTYVNDKVHVLYITISRHLNSDLIFVFLIEKNSSFIFLCYFQMDLEMDHFFFFTGYVIIDWIATYNTVLVK